MFFRGVLAASCKVGGLSTEDSRGAHCGFRGLLEPGQRQFPLATRLIYLNAATSLNASSPVTRQDQEFLLTSIRTRRSETDKYEPTEGKSAIEGCEDARLVG